MREMFPALVLIAGCAAPPPAAAPAHPAAELRQGDVTVALYREPCALAQVANLHFRASWDDPKRGHWEGCYSVQHDTVVVLFFEDGSVITAPLHLFGPPAPPEPLKARPISF